MNNARYLREIDFARVDFYERTKLYKTIVSKGGSVVQGATTVRYRRFIRPLSLFKITSNIIYWDDQFIYMEHRFVSPVDGFIHCVAICRQRLIGVSADEVINCLLLSPESNVIKNGLSKVENGDLVQGKPDLPLDVTQKSNGESQRWHDFNFEFCFRLPNGSSITIFQATNCAKMAVFKLRKVDMCWKGLRFCLI